MSILTTDLRTKIRDVTSEEVSFYEEHGWVMLREFVSPDVAAELLEASATALPADPPPSGSRVRKRLAVDGVEPFRSVVFSRQMALVARALVNRSRLTDVDVPLQYHDDTLWCKEPSASSSPYHQDDPIRPGDRAGVFNLWLALAEVTPEMGAMRFVTGAHREGPLGVMRGDAVGNIDQLRGSDARLDMKTVVALDDATRESLRHHDLLTYYPKLLDQYELSPPFHYQPGDATVHHAFMIHGAPPNTTDRQRWCYIMEYTPADTLYFYDGDVRRVARSDQHPLPDRTHPVVSS